MIVVDTNIVCYLLLERDKTGQAQALFTADNDWILPSLWRHEFLHVLANYIRHAGVELAAMKTVWHRGIEYFQSSERQPDMLQSLELAAQLDISAYDAQFIALAESFDVPLISEDKRLRDRCPGRVINMTEYVEGS